jgi:hypothetical protein
MEDKAVDKTAGVVAFVAGLVAAVKLARVESRKFRTEVHACAATADSVSIARIVIEAAKARR